MLDTGSATRLREIPGLGLFFFCGEVLPEIRHAVRAVGACKRLFQAFEIVEIRLHDFSAAGGKRPRLVPRRIARDRPARKFAGAVVQDGVAKPTALSARGT